MDVIYFLKIGCYSVGLACLVILAIIGIKAVQAMATINKMLDRIDMLTDVKNALGFFSWIRKKKK